MPTAESERRGQSHPEKIYSRVPRPFHRLGLNPRRVLTLRSQDPRRRLRAGAPPQSAPPDRSAGSLRSSSGRRSEPGSTRGKLSFASPPARSDGRPRNPLFPRPASRRASLHCSLVGSPSGTPTPHPGLELKCRRLQCVHELAVRLRTGYGTWPCRNH